MLNFFYDPKYIGLAAFFGGLLVARIFGSGKSKTKEEETTAIDRRVRSLEADLRVSNKNLQKSKEKLEAAREEIKSLHATVTDVQAALDERTTELEETREALQAECRKTQSLRQDLTGRAEQTIRAEVHARQVEVELSVLKAGATGIHEAQADRVCEEPPELTSRLSQLEDEFLAVEAMEEEEQQEQPVANRTFADC